MTAERPIVKPRRTWRRWLLRAAMWMLAILVISLATAWVSLKREEWKGRQELARVVAELEESDPRWRWEQIEADIGEVPDEENSMRVIAAILEAMGDWKPDTLTLDNGDHFMAERPSANRRLGEIQLATLRKELGANEKPIAMALSLKDYRRGRTPMQLNLDYINTLLPHAQPVRLVAFLLDLDIERMLHTERATAVPDRIRAMFRAGAGLRDDHMLICQLLRIAVRSVAVRRVERLLAMAEVDDATCRRLADDISAEREENLLLVGLRGERAGCHHLFGNLESGKLALARFMHEAPGNTGDPDWMLRLMSVAYAYRLPDDHAFLLTRLNEQCEIARLPIEEQLAAWKVFDIEMRASRAKVGPEFRRLFSHLLMPSAIKVGEASLREHAHLSCTLVALAAERFRLANKRWPKSIEELCPAYLNKVPIDPFDGQPLRFQTREDGIVVYAIGKDGEDNDGNLDIRDVPGSDNGVRLYDPDQRNLPPLPKDKPEDDR